jgi:hypothetical protein
MRIGGRERLPEDVARLRPRRQWRATLSAAGEVLLFEALASERGQERAPLDAELGRPRLHLLQLLYADPGAPHALQPAEEGGEARTVPRTVERASLCSSVPSSEFRSFSRKT